MEPVIQDNLHVLYHDSALIVGTYFLDGSRYLVIITFAGDHAALLIIDDTDGNPVTLEGAGSVRFLVPLQSLREFKNKDFCRILDSRIRQIRKENT